MVRKVLSKYGGSPPVDDSSNRKIQTKSPINPVDEVLQILNQNLPKTMTRKSIADLQRMQFDEEELRDLIKDAISYGKYRDSEWCESSDKSPWFACDSYEVKRREYNENAHKHLDVYYFLKFCIHKSGNIICTFSCHFSN